MKLGRWSLKKLFTFLEIIAVFIAAMCIALVYFNYQATRQFTTSTVERYDSLYRVFGYNDVFYNIVHEYLFASDDMSQNVLEHYQQKQDEFEADFEQLMENTELASTRVYLKGLHNMFSYYHASISDVISAHVGGNRLAAYELFGEVSHRSDLIKEVLLRYHLLYSDDVDYYVQKGLSEYDHLQRTQMLVCTLILVVTMAAMAYLLQINQKSIAFLMECTERIAAGDYGYVRQQVFPEESDWGRLGIAIQHMNARIEYYLGEMKEKNRLSMEMAALENERLRMYQCAREAEFKAMHNQMSPHFVYNTLNIALQLAYDEKAERTVKLMRVIIDFMRYYTKNVTSIIDLDSEINFVQNYVYINEMRYGERISFSIHKADDVPNIKLPAVTIQPLVENAVIHGLKDCEDQGSVQIEITKNEDFVLISVEDNGRGIEYEKLEELISASDEKMHIGLHNVRERLRFCFGDLASLNIESLPGCGTVITLRLPLNRAVMGDR